MALEHLGRMPVAGSRPILIVEDDDDIREALRELLEIEGFKVETAQNGKAALAKLEQMAHPCLILLDLFMPVLDGPGFLAALRAEDKVATIPVLIISAAPESGSAARSALPAAQGFLKKPVHMGILFNLVRTYCCDGAGGA